MAQALPGKWKLGKIPPMEAGGQDYAKEEIKTLVSTFRRNLGPRPPPAMLSSRLLMGTDLARCLWYFVCVICINYHIFYLQVYTEAGDAR